MDKLFSADRETEKQYAELYGGYNDFPPNWKQITTQELIRDTQFRTYSPELIDTRQMCRYPFVKDKRKRAKLEKEQKSKPLLSATLYHYFDGSGIAIECDYQNNELRFYSFYYCKHEFKTTTHQMCYWEGKCVKCGFRNAVDSSG